MLNENVHIYSTCVLLAFSWNNYIVMSGYQHL